MNIYQHERKWQEELIETQQIGPTPTQYHSQNDSGKFQD